MKNEVKLASLTVSWERRSSQQTQVAQPCLMLSGVDACGKVILREDAVYDVCTVILILLHCFVCNEWRQSAVIQHPDLYNFPYFRKTLPSLVPACSQKLQIYLSKSWSVIPNRQNGGQRTIAPTSVRSFVCVCVCVCVCLCVCLSLGTNFRKIPLGAKRWLINKPTANLKWDSNPAKCKHSLS